VVASFMDHCSLTLDASQSLICFWIPSVAWSMSVLSTIGSYHAYPNVMFPFPPPTTHLSAAPPVAVAFQMKIMRPVFHLLRSAISSEGHVPTFVISKLLTFFMPSADGKRGFYIAAQPPWKANVCINTFLVQDIYDWALEAL